MWKEVKVLLTISLQNIRQVHADMRLFDYNFIIMLGKVPVHVYSKSAFKTEEFPLNIVDQILIFGTIIND